MSNTNKDMEQKECKLVKVVGVEGFHMGYFNEVLKEWVITGFNGGWEVSEWWDLPTEGTGNTPHQCTGNKQPTLKQLNQALTNSCKTWKTFNAGKLSTQKQHDTAKAQADKSDKRYWELVEAVTEENPEYAEIIENGHYEC